MKAVALALVLIVAALLVPPRYAAAAEGAGQLLVRVLDARTRAPLPLSTVDIYGPRSLRGAAGTDGVAPFTPAPDGVYEVVVRHFGYEEQAVHDIALAGHGTRTVDVLLVPLPRRPSWLQQIGRTKTKTAPGAAANRVDEKTPETLLSSDPLRGAATLPGVTTENTAAGSTVSVFGHSAASTTVTVDGAPVAGFGTPVNVQPFSIDVFQSVSVDARSAFGSPGGNVNFDTRNPALDWAGNLGAFAGSFAQNGESLTEAGTTGRLGLSFTHARRDETLPINGLSYLDTSGASYRHDAITDTIGDAFKLRYPFSRSHILSGSLVGISSSAPLTCSVFTAFVPCGYGPRNLQTTNLQAGQLHDTLVRGRVSATVSVFGNRTTVDLDQTGRYVGGMLAPQYSTATTSNRGAILDAQYALPNGSSLGLTATLDGQTTSTRGAAFGTYLPPVSVSNVYRDVALSLPILSARRTSATLALGAQSQGSRGAFTGDLTVNGRLSNTDTLTLEQRSGFLAAPPLTFTGLGDPSALQPDCAAGVATGAGPSSGASSSGSETTTLTWKREGRRTSVTAALRHEIDFDAPVTAFVNGLAFPSLVTPQYLDAARLAFAGACGGAGIDAASLYFQTTATAPRVQYDGGTLGFHTDLGRNLGLDLSYAVVSARASAGSGPLFSRLSTLGAGEQLPNVPIQTANIAAIGRIGKHGLRALANIRHVGVNNPNNLPAYTTVDLGLDQTFRHAAHFTVSALNVTGTYAGIFAGTANAVPLSSAAGLFPTVATPLRPRSINLAWRMPFGLGAALDDAPSYDTPSNAYGFRLYPYSQAIPDAFAIDRRSGRCGPENVASATHSIGLVKAYAAEIESIRRTTGAYPAEFPTRLRDGLQLTYRRTGATYAVLVSADPQLTFTDQLPVLRPFTGCARFYAGTLEEARQRGLYVPSYDERRALRPVAAFSPGIGFYMPPSPLENDGLFPDYADEPTSPPADPFALSDERRCEPSARAGALALVALLKPYITAVYAGADRPALPPDLTVEQRGEGSKRWLLIRSPDLNVSLLARCLRISLLSKAGAERLGIDGTSYPSLDFAPQLGFYNKF